MCTSLNTYGRVFLYSGAGVKVGYDVLSNTAKKGERLTLQ
jgi:hypothetical protein